MKIRLKVTTVLILFEGLLVHAADDMKLQLRAETTKDRKTVYENVENQRSIASVPEAVVPFQILDPKELKSNYASTNKDQYEKHKSKSAFESLSKSCRGNSIDDCKKAAQQVKSDQDRENLKQHCDQDPSSCSILGYLYLQQGKLDKAKTVFKDLCIQKSFPKGNSWLMCDEASKLIKLPEDAQNYAELELECQQYALEPETEDENEQERAISSLEQACKDRVGHLEQLKDKYRGDEDVIFRLNNPPVL